MLTCSTASNNTGCTPCNIRLFNTMWVWKWGLIDWPWSEWLHNFYFNIWSLYFFQTSSRTVHLVIWSASLRSASSFKFLTFISWNIPWWDHFKCPTLWAQIEADPVYKLKTWYFVTISMMRTNSATLYKGECNCHHDRKLANCFAWVRVC